MLRRTCRGWILNDPASTYQINSIFLNTPWHKCRAKVICGDSMSPFSVEIISMQACNELFCGYMSCVFLVPYQR